MMIEMKKFTMAKLGLTMSLMFGTVMLPANCTQAEAAEVIATVPGTVLSGTTAELLKLSTRDGEMEIKIDSGTDTSECKILLPDTKISVSVSHGNDGYLHAVKLYADAQTPTVSMDSDTTATITGTIGDKTKDDVLHFITSAGEMEIKLDTTTNMNGCSVLVVDKAYTITCVRGSDAYMHAVSISDASSGAATYSPSGNYDASYTPAPKAAVGVETTWVTGTVNDKTKENLMYLAVNGGEMQVVIDDNTDARNGYVLTPGTKVTVAVYRGSDAYMHAANIIGTKDNYQSAQVDSSSPSSVTGTVGSKSNENVLFLVTNAGEMELKLDAVSSVTNCKVLVEGKKITVTCARGSDAYMHALSITGA